MKGFLGNFLLCFAGLVAVVFLLGWLILDNIWGILVVGALMMAVPLSMAEGLGREVDALEKRIAQLEEQRKEDEKA